MLLDDREGGGAALARRRLAEDGGGWVEVVAHDERGADPIPHLHERREGHRLAVGTRHLQLVDRPADVAAMNRIGLHVDLPRTAEAVEVVDVVRAQLHLQRLEEVLELDADRRGLLPVDVEKQPGCARGKVGEQAGQAAVLLSRLHHGGGRLLEEGRAVVASILDHELEARHRAEAVDRRRPEDLDAGLVHRGLPLTAKP